MYVIGTSIGFILKFSSLEDLKVVINNLVDLFAWAEKQRAVEGQSVKLVYMIHDSAIDSKKAQELIDTLPEIEIIREKRL